MHFAKVLISFTALAGAAVAQNAFSVATPQTLQQCTPYQISITGGSPPFNIRITQPGEVGDIIETLPSTSSRSVVWQCNVASGQKISILVVDSQGNQAPSGESNSIASNSDSSCLNQSASISSGPSATGGSGGSSSSSSSKSGGSSSSTSSSGDNDDDNTSSSGGGQTSAAAPAETSSSSGGDSNGAMPLSGASAAIAGAVGAVVAALL